MVLSLELPASAALSLENMGSVVLGEVQMLSLHDLTYYGQSHSYYLVRQFHDSSKKSSLCEDGHTYAGVQFLTLSSPHNDIYILNIKAFGFHHADQFEGHCFLMSSEFCRPPMSVQKSL
jgi:hypothetical protein